MHIAEGVLTPATLVAGAAGAAVLVAYGLRRLPESRLMTAGLAAAAFFCASLVHFPIGISSAHLVLNGLLGVLLGWAAVPVIFTALLLQAVLLQFGGITVLGVNTLTMGLGAVVAGALFRTAAGRDPSRARLAAASFAAGLSGVLFSSVITAGAVALANEGFRAAATALLVAHVPVMLVEGVVTAIACAYIRRWHPDYFDFGKADRRDGK